MFQERRVYIHNSPFLLIYLRFPYRFLFLPKLNDSCVGAILVVARTVCNIYCKRVGVNPTPTDKVSPNGQTVEFLYIEQ